MKRPDCACVHPDARECLRWRGSAFIAREEEFDRDDRCECCCHDQDEDGFDGWDDEDDRAKGPREDPW
jgi:hypothetical protein